MSPVAAIAFATIFAAHSALAAPFAMDLLLERDDTPSFNLTQNALDAQALNSIFGSIDANSSCSGQFGAYMSRPQEGSLLTTHPESDMACVANNVAVCQNGKWQTLDECGQFQCLALPVMAGNGTVCTLPRALRGPRILMMFAPSDHLLHFCYVRR